MSFFRRLFSRGGDAARWQKILAPTPGAPKLDLVAALAKDGEAGQLSRMALALGMLAHQILEEKIGSLTATLPPAERGGIERAQARLWLQAALPRQKDLEGELRPVLELGEPDAHKKVVTHVELALRRVYGNGPGEPALARWLKGFAAEVQPLIEKGAMPPALGVQDHDARSTFESNEFVAKVDAAKQSFVLAADRVAATFTGGEPDGATITNALGNGKLLEGTASDLEAMRTTWKSWLSDKREQALIRGRNTKPAFIEGETVPEQRLASITKVMSLADLPPEAPDGAAPPPPLEQSGPNVQPPPLPPNVTQEVSLAQIEAESGAFQAPAHTQEVSLAQIEAMANAQAPASDPATTSQAPSAPPPATEPPQSAEGVATSAPIPPVTTDAPAPAAPSTEPPQSAEGAASSVLAPPSGTDAAPTPAHTASNNTHAHENGVAKPDEGEPPQPPAQDAKTGASAPPPEPQRE